MSFKMRHGLKHEEKAKRPRRNIIRLGVSGYFELRYGKSFIIVAYRLCPRGMFRIDNLYVEEKKRDKGLGSALVGIVEDVAKELGVKMITTSTSMADGFWEKLGYEKIESELGSFFIKKLR